jgi:hypothetical protein
MQHPYCIIFFDVVRNELILGKRAFKGKTRYCMLGSLGQLSYTSPDITCKEKGDAASLGVFGKYYSQCSFTTYKFITDDKVTDGYCALASYNGPKVSICTEFKTVSPDFEKFTPFETLLRFPVQQIVDARIAKGDALVVGDLRVLYDDHAHGQAIAQSTQRVLCDIANNSTIFDDALKANPPSTTVQAPPIKFQSKADQLADKMRDLLADSDTATVVSAPLSTANTTTTTVPACPHADEESDVDSEWDYDEFSIETTTQVKA